MKTTARVRVTLDVYAGSAWNPDCTAKQIVEQASQESVRRIYEALKSSDCKIVGKPVVEIVTSMVDTAAGGSARAGTG